MAAWTHLHRLIIGDGGPKYAAHIGFFPSARTGFPGAQLTGAPILFMVDRDDDWTPRQLIDRLVNFWRLSYLELPVTVREYSSGHNWFSEGARQYQPGVSVWGRCPLQIVMSPQQYGLLYPDGVLREFSETAPDLTRQIRDEYAKCMTRGAAITPNVSVANQSLDDAVNFLKKSFDHAILR